MNAELHHLGRVDYAATYAAMQDFTHQRGRWPSQNVRDQLWICEHLPVFTQGLSGKAEHVLAAGDVAVVATDRGGQVTYHGPGQVMAYPLLDLKRAGYFVKEYVYRLEESVIRSLAHFGVTGHRVAGAPGIYVRLADPRSHAALQLGASSSGDKFQGLGKIAALGIKVSRHCSYHGLALNVAMDLEPFTRINPCGYPNLQTTDLASLGVQTTWDDAAQVLVSKLTTYLAP
jgi:lipoyl(octanoyl) transferase